MTKYPMLKKLGIKPALIRKLRVLHCETISRVDGCGFRIKLGYMEPYIHADILPTLTQIAEVVIGTGLVVTETLGQEEYDQAKAEVIALLDPHRERLGLEFQAAAKAHLFQSIGWMSEVITEQEVIHAYRLGKVETVLIE